MVKKENPKPEKDYKDQTVDENGIITYNIQPHDVVLDAIFEFKIIPTKSTNE